MHDPHSPPLAPLGRIGLTCIGALALLVHAQSAFAQDEAVSPPPPPAASEAAPASEDVVSPAPVSEPAPAAPLPEPDPVVPVETAETDPPALVDPPEDSPEAEDESGFNPSISYGVGLRNQTAIVAGDDGGFTGTTFGPADTGLVMNDINVRPYIYGSFHKKVAFEANLNAWAATPGLNAGVEILDAVMKFAIDDAFQIWAGRFLPPSDRANLSGPYFQNAWLYPLEMGYPRNIGSGRDNGLAVWGQVLEGMFRYQVGVFSLDGGAVRPQARLVLNLLDPESKTPFYYNSSTYYGTAGTILALGVSGAYEKNGVGVDTDGDGTPDSFDDYKAVQADVLFELPFGKEGALDLEGGFYFYDADDMRLMALGSVLIPNTPLQPSLRVMVSPMGGPGDPTTSIDAAINLILDGHNLRLSLVERIDLDAAADTATFSTILGMQGQIWP